jgi:MFS family permease
MGYVGVGMSVGILVAPLLGGVVYDRAGYNAVYAMAYALIGVDVVLRMLLVEKKVAARWDSSVTDTEGGVARDASLDGSDVEKGKDIGSSPSVPDNQEAITSTPKTSPTQTTQNHETNPPRSRMRDRLPPVLSLLYSRRLLAVLYAAIIQAAIMTSFDSVLTLHVAATFHWNSTGAALLFLPIVIPSFLGPLFGYISDRHGGRYPATFGFLLTCPPLVCLRFINENTTKDKVLLCAFLALVGLFLTLTFPPIMAEISAVVAQKDRKMVESGKVGYGKGGAYAQAYALFNMAYAAGCLVGPLAAGFLVQERGWGTMSWVLGVLAGVTALPTWLWMGGYVFGKKG